MQNEIIAMTKGSEPNKEAPAETNMWTTKLMLKNGKLVSV